jgi:hypothetical protein
MGAVEALHKLLISDRNGFDLISLRHANLPLFSEREVDTKIAELQYSGEFHT